MSLENQLIQDQHKTKDSSSGSTEASFQQFQGYKNDFLYSLVIALKFRFCIRSMKQKNNLNFPQIPQSHLLKTPSSCHIYDIYNTLNIPIHMCLFLYTLNSCFYVLFICLFLFQYTHIISIDD